jgi:hypothetical protein
MVEAYGLYGIVSLSEPRMRGAGTLTEVHGERRARAYVWGSGGAKKKLERRFGALWYHRSTG